MKKKILFIGPIGDFGGRELETGFMAKSLSNDFDIEILSTGNLTLNSQIFDFVPTEIVQTLNECIYKNSFRFRIPPSSEIFVHLFPCSTEQF